MKVKFTIGRKIGTGFGVLIFFIIIVFTITANTVREGIESFTQSRELNEKITTLFDPSIKQVTLLKEKIKESKRLIQNWVNSPSREDNPEKIQLKILISDVIPKTQDTLASLQSRWDSETEQLLLKKVNANLDTLFEYYQIIMDHLPDLGSYDDPIAFLSARDYVVPNGLIDIKSQQVDNLISDLINRQSKSRRYAIRMQNESSQETTYSFDNLLKLVIILGIALMIGATLIATFTTRSIVRPVHELRDVLLGLGRGLFPRKTLRPTRDEIGEMGDALNSLVEGLKRTTEFSKQVGSGNFDYDYLPLSDDDTLGHALLKMRDDLAENERILEQKVVERTEEVVRQRDEIERQRMKVEELYKDVTDSIRYAKRLQDSILPPERYIQQILPNSFVLFKPKDIVSGDFYWFEQSKGKILFAAVDCTGHGVPGAFMSLVGANALNQAVREHGLTKPSEILDDLNKLLSEALNKGMEEQAVRDGMDLALCAIDPEKRTLEFAGANNPLYLVRNGELIQTKPDKLAIGGMDHGAHKYKNHQVEVASDDIIYIFSDGYADQFGGEKGKKFMYKQFKETLKEIAPLPMNKQRDELNRIIENWRGIYEQIDDILIIGVKL
jgi:serine phosphatase RsbU (regulator of sigma subunit)/HAMP domain-containing protein